jgi:serine/threonine protein kinase
VNRDMLLYAKCDECHLQVADLGSSRLMIDTATSFVGTPLYMAPEVLTQQPYSMESDIWSLGSLIYQLCMLELPFFATSMHALRVRCHLPSSAGCGASLLTSRRIGLVLKLWREQLARDLEPKSQ